MEKFAEIDFRRLFHFTMHLQSVQNNGMNRACSMRNTNFSEKRRYLRRGNSKSRWKYTQKRVGEILWVRL